MTRPTDDALAELARQARLASDSRPVDTSEGLLMPVPMLVMPPATVAALVAEVQRLRAAVAEMVDYAEHSFERHEPGVTCRSCAVVEIGRRALDGAE